ncbi:PPE family protein [Mycobacterium tilburgii]|uniref:PPE family protein n=1 Tax=Mycobacterium tilburgii TaxID=44467 RepID=UPI001642E098|nr:PPE family protein [Mycobacterium tilburgii]
MTSPIWLAFPPEVHSSLLTNGPGPGPLLAVAAQWQNLSGHYSQAAIELSCVLTEIQTSSWQGPSSALYVLAHVPYLAWLEGAAAKSAVTAAAHETVAAAYVAAFAEMPTLPELVANHAAHATLVATNFFGINTIPIALNEADYVRMWIQAAQAMSVYEMTSAAALTSVPVIPPPPGILAHAQSSASGMGGGMGPPTPPQGLWNQIKWLLQTLLQQYEFFIKWLLDPASFTPQQILDGLIGTLKTLLFQLIPDLLLHPSIGSFFLVLVYVSMALVHASQLLIVALPYLAPLVAPAVLAAAGLTGLGTLGAIPTGVGTAPVAALAPPVPSAPAFQRLTPPITPPTFTGPTSSPSSPQPTALHTDAPAPGAASPASGALSLYAAAATPDSGGWLEPPTTSVAAAAVSRGEEQSATTAVLPPRSRRRTKTGTRDYAHRHEYLECAPEDGPAGHHELWPSAQGAGVIGSSGTEPVGDRPRGLVFDAPIGAAARIVPLLPQSQAGEDV